MRIWPLPPGRRARVAIRERVAAARKIQQTRLAPYGESCNARIPAGALGEVCPAHTGGRPDSADGL